MWKSCDAAYEQAVTVLPDRLRRAALSVPKEIQRQAEEIRLRSGNPMTILHCGGELDTGAVAEPADLEALCNLATEFSRYAAVETICQGFVPLSGGGRVGLCGSAVMKDGRCTNLRDLSSAAIRIPRAVSGIAEPLMPELFENGAFQSTLILSPPGGGKTTLLRDCIRVLSDGWGGHSGLRVALADERGEVAVMRRGRPGMELGQRTDVLEGCPKAEAIPMLLRAMNPQVIAVDEITAEADLQAMTMAANCGAALLATIHAADVAELTRKPLYDRLLKTGAFARAVIISRDGENRCYRVEKLQCES